VEERTDDERKDHGDWADQEFGGPTRRAKLVLIAVVGVLVLVGAVLCCAEGLQFLQYIKPEFWLPPTGTPS
jgi:hypothetical protein